MGQKYKMTITYEVKEDIVTKTTVEELFNLKDIESDIIELRNELKELEKSPQEITTIDEDRRIKIEELNNSIEKLTGTLVKYNGQNL